MLPRVAPMTGTAQSSPALQAGVSSDAVARPQPSAATLANLRADVLLRLIETMLKHMPPAAEPNAGRDLLETLLAALKTTPGREGENGRKLADLLAKLPPELRPAVEKLINTVLSSMPTRTLMEIVRNPNGPDAQKLATIIAANVNTAALSTPANDRQPRPMGLTAQQLAAVARQGTPQLADPTAGDVRALQSALKRVFDLDTGKPRAVSSQTGDADAGRQPTTAATRLPADPGSVPKAENRPPVSAGRAATGQPVDAIEAAPRHMGDAEEVETTAPATRRGDQTGRTQFAVGQVLARSVLQAVARDIPSALLMQAVTQLMETLSPEEANFLRALFDRPLDPAPEQDAVLATADLPEEAAEGTAKTGKPGTETAQQPASLPQSADDDGKPLPLPQSREAAHAAIADTTPERLLTALPLREGVPVAFVPYLPAEDETEWRDEREAEQEEAAEENGTEGDNQSGEEPMADAEGETGDDEPESPDMARRREKTADMVGVIEPGLVFYQKLGEYWT
ncbi:hypothetical protein MNR02_14415 [Shinella sp. H4-D48]|uniref:hypothetical protein n=1 Tax=Shinella sp. H4-D48 TaxID=2925841 RepID=UPI001F53E135|nr:hypothetical protein [Shinella sp. H4-D48]UNK37646.1 hypothetical protein MNR02_14415 [Shinella sp. H4-D48]